MTMNEEALHMEILELQLENNDTTVKVSSESCTETTTYITTDQFHKICRTCLAKGDHRSIFEVTYDDTPVSDILRLHASVQVQQEDCLPQNMCTNCLAELFRLYYFVQKCQRSDVTLRYVIEADLKSNLDIKKDMSPKQDYLYSTNSDNQEGSAEDEELDVKTKPKRKNTAKIARKRRCNVQMRQDNRVRGPPFKCRDCGESYDTFDTLKTHRKEAKHPEARNHACSVCSKMFTSSKLRQHMRAHTKEKPYQCKVCFQGFSMSGNLKRHMMTHTGERPHVCEVCGKGFIQATTLQNHKKTHTKYERMGGDANSPHFICNYCGRGFKRLARYNAHLKKHFSEGGGNASDDAKKASQDEEPREHVCMICKRAYKTKHLLKAHQLTHGEKTFLCNECGKGFVTKAALLSHLKVHTGEKPHTCNVCKKSFAHVGSFEAHMLIHTGQKPYNCNICTKAFTQLSHLKYHLRTHSGERPYICSFCGKSFALKGNLTVHVRTHTGETPYVCPVCGKGFYDSSSMKKHKRGHGEVAALPASQAVTADVGHISNVVMNQRDLVFT